ncbi:MAG: sialidase family protein [Acidimicrobiales bacterium]
MLAPRTRRRAGLLVLPLLLGVVGGPAQGPDAGNGEPVVTAAVQVTKNPDPARAHATPQLARNPKTGELVIAETEYRTTLACNVHISTDDGRSWAPGGQFMLAPFTNCGGDPLSTINLHMAFDPSGILYLAYTAHDPKWDTMGIARSDRPRHVLLARSEDSGRSWTNTVVYTPPEGTTGDPKTSNRRTMVAVDPKNPQWVYIVWQQPGGTGKPEKSLVLASSDGARTFSGEPVNTADDRGGYQGRPAVDGEGVLHIVTPSRGFLDPPRPTDPAVRPSVYRFSTDNGKTFSPAVDIDPGNQGFSFSRKQMLAADPNSPNLYFTWYGNPNQKAKRPAAGQPPSPEFDDRTVYLRSSNDGGKSWSEPKTVNDDASTKMNQHYDPNLFIAPNGRLDMAWYDFRSSPTPEGEGAGGNAGGFNDVFYASSTDGGRSITKNVRISDRIIDRNIGVWSNNTHIHGNVGIASSEDSVYFAWQDSRNGNSVTNTEDIYFASLKLEGTAPVGDDEGTPGWILAGAGVAVGMGLAMLLVYLISRRRTAP